MYERFFQIGLLQLRYGCHIVNGKYPFSFAKRGSDECLQFVQTQGRVVFQQCDALAHALYSLRLQFLLTGRDGL